MATTVGVKLEDDIRDRLKALGELRHRSTHWIMREAIREYLDREEEIEKRNREADEAWEEYRQSRKGVGDDAMTPWLESWGTDQEGPCPDPEPLR